MWRVPGPSSRTRSTSSIFFGLSAIGAYVVPSTGELLNAALANSGTFLGAVGFFVGAALLLPEASSVRSSDAASGELLISR